ncbi:nucleotide disphospho-sugar-binding domain-containing protein [Streptomyces sp. NPDC003032]
MKVLFTASDWRGHYFCMMPLGRALRAAGHEVRVACTPGQARSVSRAGLVPAAVLDSADMPTILRMTNYLEAMAGSPGHPLPLHPYTGEPVVSLDEFDIEREAPFFFESCHDAIRRSYDGAVRFARSWHPDLVLHDLMTPEGALAARLTDVPSVYFPPGLFGTVETEPGVDLGDGDPSGSFVRYGQRPWDGGQIEYLIDTSPSLALPPAGSARRLPMRYVPYNGPGGVEPWLLSPRTRPRLTVLWGSSSGAEASASRAVGAAMAQGIDSGAEVILTAHPKQVRELGPLPDGVRVLNGFPLHLLLDRSDGVVHHGSVNALMTAAACGVPQLALPLNEEQITVSGRIARTGAALALPGLRAEPDEVRALTAGLLTDPSLKDAARVIREDIESRPSPAEVVPQLVAIAA